MQNAYVARSFFVVAVGFCAAFPNLAAAASLGFIQCPTFSTARSNYAGDPLAATK